MKKAAITLAVLLSLSLCLMVSASAIIGGTATEVSFTQENVVGDSASAEGFSVQSLFTLKGHAHWDTTLTLGKNPTWNTDFSYSTIAKAESYSVEPYVNLYTLAGFSVSGSNINPEEHADLAPYVGVLAQMAQEAPAGAVGYTKTLPLSEIMPYFPLALDAYGTGYAIDSSASLEMTDFLTRFFHIPTDGYEVQITIDTDGDKKIDGVNISVTEGPSPLNPGIVVENSLYLAFEAWDWRTDEAIPGGAPSGIYRIPIENAAPSLEQTELVLPVEGHFLKLGAMENGSELFLLTQVPKGGSLGIFIDANTGEVLHSFETAEDLTDATVFIEENYVVILSQPNEDAIPQRAVVWAKGSDGKYRKMIDTDISQATFSDCRSFRSLYDEVQNRLLIAGFQNTYVSPSLQVAVCQENTMTYAATFISSQDALRKTTFFQAADEFPRLHLAQTQ